MALLHIWIRCNLPAYDPDCVKTLLTVILLERLPRDGSHTLRAWDASDEYLVQHLHEHYFHDQSDCQQPLIFNDSFGALGVSLKDYQPVLINDSFVSQQAAQANLEFPARTNPHSPNEGILA